MLYLAISVVLHALINNGLRWYQTWNYNRRAAVVKRGTLEYGGMRYRVTSILEN